MKKYLGIAATLVILFSTGCETIAKTGGIEGKVVSKIDGSAIANATVWTAPPTSRVLTATDGSYYIDGVEPGTYTVFATASGFHEDSIKVTVVAGNKARADFMLEPGPLSDAQ